MDELKEATLSQCAELQRQARRMIRGRALNYAAEFLVIAIRFLVLPMLAEVENWVFTTIQLTTSEESQWSILRGWQSPLRILDLAQDVVEKLVTPCSEAEALLREFESKFLEIRGVESNFNVHTLMRRYLSESRSPSFDTTNMTLESNHHFSIHECRGPFNGPSCYPAPPPYLPLTLPTPEPDMLDEMSTYEQQSEDDAGVLRSIPSRSSTPETQGEGDVIGIDMYISVLSYEVGGNVEVKELAMATLRQEESVYFRPRCPYSWLLPSMQAALVQQGLPSVEYWDGGDASQERFPDWIRSLLDNTRTVFMKEGDEKNIRLVRSIFPGRVILVPANPWGPTQNIPRCLQHQTYTTAKCALEEACILWAMVRRHHWHLVPSTRSNSRINNPEGGA